MGVLWYGEGFAEENETMKESAKREKMGGAEG
jgi:hypothetical protein